jgi:DNA sulfur modification protein DndE
MKLKKRTGLDRWNELCRIALCHSLSNPTPPPVVGKTGDGSIDMEWKTFAGPFQEELAAIIMFRVREDSIDLSRREALAEYFRSHLERGISSLQNIKSITMLYENNMQNKV